MKRLDKKEMKLVAGSGAVSSVQTACYFPIMLGTPCKPRPPSCGGGSWTGGGKWGC